MLTQKELKDWHDKIFKAAKEVMLRDSCHVPVAIMVTEKDLIRTTKSSNLKIADLAALKMNPSMTSDELFEQTAQRGAMLNPNKMKAGEPVFITIPLFFTSKQRIGIILEMIERKGTLPEEKMAELQITLSELAKIGKDELGVEDPYKTISDVILKATGVGEKDLQAYVLQRSISMCGAYAFCKIDEMWVTKKETRIQTEGLSKEERQKQLEKEYQKEEQKGCSQDPDRIEGIGVQLETTEVQRLLFASVNKEGGRDSNTKVLSFGKTEELINTQGKDIHLQGRFVDLLRKAEKLDPPKAQA